MSVKILSKTKYIFSGHESFQCRNLWLKKGYDFVKKGKSFNDEDALVTLGVGKNMVSSIRFWMKAFGILSPDDTLTSFAHKLLANDGWDPYLEDEGTLWLLHYFLVTNGIASTYSIIFNEFRKEKIEFTKENFISFINRKTESDNMSSISAKTLDEDFSVFTKMYLRSNIQSKDKEDSFSGLLTDLDLMKTYSKGKLDYYQIENSERSEIPVEIILFAILESESFDLSVGLQDLELNINSVGTVFAINRSGLLNKVENMVAKYNYIIFNDQAGIKELQFKKKPIPTTILEKYYAD